MYEVLSLDDYTDAEHEATWRTEADAKITETELIKTLLIVRNHDDGTIPQNIEESEQLTIRGIETISSIETRQEAMSSKNLVINSVLDAQDTVTSPHSSTGNTAEEYIKNASLQCSESAISIAIVRGAMDAAFVRQFRTENSDAHQASP